MQLRERMRQRVKRLRGRLAELLRHVAQTRRRERRHVFVEVEMHEARDDRFHRMVAERLQDGMCRFEYVRFVSRSALPETTGMVREPLCRRIVPHRLAHKTLEALARAGDKKSEPLQHLMSAPERQTSVPPHLRVGKRLIRIRKDVRGPRRNACVYRKRFSRALKDKLFQGEAAPAAGRDDGFLPRRINKYARARGDAEVRRGVEKIILQPVAAQVLQEIFYFSVHDGGRVYNFRRKGVQPIDEKAVALDELKKSREYRFIAGKMSCAAVGVRLCQYHFVLLEFVVPIREVCRNERFRAAQEFPAGNPADHTVGAAYIRGKLFLLPRQEVV